MSVLENEIPALNKGEDGIIAPEVIDRTQWDTLIQAVNSLTVSVAEIKQKQESSEKERRKSAAPEERRPTIEGAYQSDFQLDPSTDRERVDYNAFNAQYLGIKDSVNRVALPGQITLGEVSLTLKGEARAKSGFIKKNSGYVTTGLKVIKLINDKQEVNQEDIEKLYAVLVAHQSMLQQEQSVCVVEGTGSGGNKELSQMFRFFTKNPTFSAQETIALENATRIVAATNQTPKKEEGEKGFNNSNRGNQRGGFRGGRGRGRGFYNNFNKNYGGDNYERSVNNANSNP